jgi:hypothetical protein
MAGYSATPLAKKLSLKSGQRVFWRGMPAAVATEILSAGLSLVRLVEPGPPIDAAHVFVTRRADLAAAIAELRTCLAPAGFLWVSWRKRASGLPTDITEDEVRHAALPTGLVDIKVCAIDETRSG